MSIATVKGKFIELVYDTGTFHTVRSEIQLGDSLFAKFDESATFFTYKYLQYWATTTGAEEPPPAFKLRKANKQKRRSFFEKLGLTRAKGEGLQIPPHCFDLAPAMVFLPRSRVKELYNDFEQILGQIKENIVWPKDSPMQ
jgi:hypothetical protein